MSMNEGIEVIAAQYNAGEHTFIDINGVPRSEFFELDEVQAKELEKRIGAVHEFCEENCVPVVIAAVFTHQRADGQSLQVSYLPGPRTPKDFARKYAAFLGDASRTAILAKLFNK